MHVATTLSWMLSFLTALLLCVAGRQRAGRSLPWWEGPAVIHACFCPAGILLALWDPEAELALIALAALMLLLDWVLHAERRDPRVPWPRRSLPLRRSRGSRRLRKPTDSRDFSVVTR